MKSTKPSASNDKIAALDEKGNPVDWWFIYKVAGKSKASDNTKPKGTEYLYYDSNFPKGKLITLSENLINDPNSGAVAHTLNQIYQSDNQELGWFFYNDEDPITNKTNGSRGHAKGVLAFDLKNNAAFWMIHSTPKFAEKGTESFPETGMGNAQSFLCISLKDSDEATKIANQMFQGQQPNVYLSSKVPLSLKSSPEDPRVQLINNKVQEGSTVYADSIPFYSAAGRKFLAIAKNKHWNKDGDDDFYNDLVAVKLNENLEVETWEHDPTPAQQDANSTHSVIDMKEVDLSPLTLTVSYEWSEENDHSKIAISDNDQSIKYVCVGDLNFTVAQEKRSGGTVAFTAEELWKSLFAILKK
jgi:deoxyribonuclease-2